jgi:putative ABC transport system substrate-binding protein
MMKRRDFIALLGSVSVWPVSALAQQTAKVPRIGYITTGSIDLAETRYAIAAFRQGLRDLGYVEGQNIVIEIRAADSKVERFPALANELVELGVDVIVASNSLSGRAAKQATATIPIVVPVMGDPVGDGLVATLAHPGSNVTGMTFLGPQLVPKRLALLKEALPSASRIAVLWHPRAYGEQTMSGMVSEAEAAASTLGIHLLFVPVEGPDELDAVAPRITAEHPDAIMVFPSPMLFTERRRIVDIASKLRLPLISMGKEFVELGGLMSYGADINDFIRRGATYVDKILKGARPSELPVEQPTKFLLFLNLNSAKQLGLAIPATLLARADEVIE